jgi:hypothetical protein
LEHEDYFLGGDATENACEISTIHLFTGHSTPEGAPGKVNLHRLRYTVTDIETGFDVNHSQITVLGKTLNSNMCAYAALRTIPSQM